MKKKWLFGFSILSGVLFLYFASHLLTRKPAALSINAQPTSAANKSQGTAAFAADAGKAELSRPDETPSQYATESSTNSGASPDFASRDFSGVTTIDPALSSTPPTPQKAPEQKKESTAPLPLVFQPVDSKAFKMTPNEKEILDRLQQNFLDEIGGTDQNPNDPQYLAQWKEARSLIDEQLKAQLGQNFFLNYQTAAGQQATKNK